MNKVGLGIFGVMMMTATTVVFAEGVNNHIAPNVPSAVCNFTTEPNMNVVLIARWEADIIPCGPGQYVPAGSIIAKECPEDSFCEGPGEGNTGFAYSETETQGKESCPDGLRSPAGSKSENDCGYILHIGNSIVYMHQGGVDRPRMVIKVGDNEYYANMSMANKPVSASMPNTKLHIKVDGVDYTVFDNSMK